MLFDLESRVELSNGTTMPRLGLGTYKATEGDSAECAVRTAIDMGYRGIDTASLYGNEEGVGAGIRSSGVPREEVFLATKVWNDEQGYDSTRQAILRSLSRLQVDYLDLYLVHWPIPSLMADTWRAMEEVYAEGLTRAIGVCNFLPHHLDQLEDLASTLPMVNQFEFHVRLQQDDAVAASVERGIAVQAWAPLMKGRVAEVPEVMAIARETGRTPAQVALRWILQRGILTIPKSVHEDRIRENSQIFDFELSRRDMALLDALDTGDRLGPDPDSFGQL